MGSNAMDSMNLSQDQIAILEENFNKVSKHPDGTTLMLIAAECGLSEEETQVSKTEKTPAASLHCRCERECFKTVWSSVFPMLLIWEAYR